MIRQSIVRDQAPRPNLVRPSIVQERRSSARPPLDLSGPLLSKKGKARAAPPTDAEAINHLVSQHGDAFAPQPFDGLRDLEMLRQRYERGDCAITST